MAATEWTLIAIACGILLTALFTWWARRYRQSQGYQQRQDWFHQLLKKEETLINTLHQQAQKIFNRGGNEGGHLQDLFEILLISFWTFVVCRSYFNFNQLVVPGGREFSSAVQTHHLWTRFQECGWCALWNGSAAGGYPAFADLFGSMLHPLVVMTTLLAGVVNGAKIALVLSFWTAGIAQWWIARELRLSAPARIWSSGIAIAGGHLSARMELGAFGIVLSTAMASLVFGAVLHLFNHPGRRGSMILGMITASAILSGQGYIQLGLLGTFPAFGFLLLDRRFRLKNSWGDYLRALIIAFLLSAVLLVPFIHFSTHFTKHTDMNLSMAQPLRYIPLNYVINDYDFYISTTLDKLPYPALNALYIGWIPVLLAGYGLTETKMISKPIKFYLISSIGLILLFASGIALRFIYIFWKMAAASRHPSLIAGLSVPLVLSFSAVGLEKILRLDWPRLSIPILLPRKNQPLHLPAEWILIFPLLFSIFQSYQFASLWIQVQKIHPEVYEVVDALRTESLQWVQPPHGDHFYVEPAVRLGLKMSPGIMTWHWKDRDIPRAKLEASYAGQPEGATRPIRTINSITIYERPDVEYAAVIQGTKSTPCSTEGLGGTISVTCETDYLGTLIIKEYSYPGWRGWRDGKRIQLSYSDWLSTFTPSGHHQNIFRYLPWDVPLGLSFSVVGMILCVILWVSPWKRNPKPSNPGRKGKIR